MHLTTIQEQKSCENSIHSNSQINQDYLQQREAFNQQEQNQLQSKIAQLEQRILDKDSKLMQWQQICQNLNDNLIELKQNEDILNKSFQAYENKFLQRKEYKRQLSSQQATLTNNSQSSLQFDPEQQQMQFRNTGGGVRSNASQAINISDSNNTMQYKSLQSPSPIPLNQPITGESSSMSFRLIENDEFGGNQNKFTQYIKRIEQLEFDIEYLTQSNQTKQNNLIEDNMILQEQLNLVSMEREDQIEHFNQIREQFQVYVNLCLHLEEKILQHNLILEKQVQKVHNQSISFEQQQLRSQKESEILISQLQIENKNLQKTLAEKNLELKQFSEKQVMNQENLISEINRLHQVLHGIQEQLEKQRIVNRELENNQKQENQKIEQIMQQLIQENQDLINKNTFFQKELKCIKDGGNIQQTNNNVNYPLTNNIINQNKVFVTPERHNNFQAKRLSISPNNGGSSRVVTQVTPGKTILQQHRTLMPPPITTSIHYLLDQYQSKFRTISPTQKCGIQLK